ncbi:hypothetical protein ABB26_09950 [Stenotrophomonas humi]|uniref:Uncharacterized protein n=1 Tax=Stenotrophomonas humi TaxID=405444 RepID=A0A0R0C291_9GAMM|nr:hypothetical protein [Stenotrophomonas humi]KRG63897.1 hypothetical protein ABB26_09950 [Stenotrophomonas humi]
MKKSPLQIDQVVYTDVVIRARPNAKEMLREDLPVTAEAAVFYDLDKNNFATLNVAQSDESYPYVIEISAFASFTLDAEGCREAYKGAFNPRVVGVNVARILFSSVRDMIASITARSPWEVAKVPTILLEPADVAIRYTKEHREDILREQFLMTEEEIEDLREQRRLRQAEAEASGKKGAQKKPSKKTSKE